MKKLISISLLVIVVCVSLTGCRSKEKEITIDKLRQIQDQITDSFVSYNEEHNNEYDNFAYCGVDEENKVVIVKLVDNSKEQQEWFRKNIMNSKYIKFEQGGPYTTFNYEDYKKVSTLRSNNVDTTILIKFGGILYGKSNSIIDYAGGTNSIGVIDKLIPNQFVPKLNGETNTTDILNALVFDKSEKSIVIFYNNEYVLFEKIK